jgi:heat shock protein HtpX
MPYSFIQIEKDKSGVIGFVFIFLSFFYVFLIAGLAVLFRCFWMSMLRNDLILRADVFNFFEWVVIIFIGIAAGVVHYFISTARLTERVLRWMGANEPDPQNDKHRMFLNVLEEISAATGGRKCHGVLIPQTSLNAFALDDEDAMAVIGITEGALYRLNREQIEGVVAHEAAHILKGDCSTATLVSAMFEFYTLPVRWWLSGAPVSQPPDDTRVSVPRGKSNLGDFFRIFSRSGPIFLFFLVLIVLFYCVTSVFALLMRMLISREAKLRADAIAVRLTRNPVGLAQAVRLLAYNWRGSGSQWEALEGVFFVNPVSGSLDERDGLFSDIFSTHPPIEKRLNVLLDMAHCSTEEFECSIQGQIKEVKNESASMLTDAQSPGRRWLLEKDGQWLGPFTLAEIGMINWLNLQTVVKKWGTDISMSAGDDPDLKIIAQNKTITRSQICPICKIPLEEIRYEKEQLQVCHSCKGTLISEDQASVIMMRRENSPGPEAMALAGRVQSQQVDLDVSWQKIGQPSTQNGYVCPHCLKTMKTKAFNLYYPVVVDKCLSCGFMWFEPGELEFLQALYEVKNPVGFQKPSA